MVNFYIKLRVVLSFTFVSCVSMTSLLAMQRIDDPNVLEDSILEAKTFPYATGVLLCKDGNMSSVVFLNETTALTTAHDFIAREKAAHIVIASDKISLFGIDDNRNFSWDLTFQKIKESGIPWSCVQRQNSLTTFTKADPEGQSIYDFQPNYFLDLLNKWENPEEELFSEILDSIRINELNYDLSGPDISVLKLRTPILLQKKPFTLKAYNFNDFSDCPAYSFGTPGNQYTSDGKIHGTVYCSKEYSHKETFSTVILPHEIKLTSNQSHFYSKLYSKCGVDGQFICGNLPSPQDKKFIGLLSGGMSGGPLVFKTSSNDYVLAGLNTAVQHKDVKFILDMIIPHLDELKEPEDDQRNASIDQWKTTLALFYEVPYPIYNVFQAFTPEIIEKINKIMEENFKK